MADRAESAVTVVTQEDLVRATHLRAKKIQPRVFQENHYFAHRLMETLSKVQIFDKMEMPFRIGAPTRGEYISKTGAGVLPTASAEQSLVMGVADSRLLCVPSTYNVLRRMIEEGDPSILFPEAERDAQDLAWAAARKMAWSILNGQGGLDVDGLFYMMEAAAPAAQTKTIHGFAKATFPWQRNPVVQQTSYFGHVGTNTRIPAGILALMSAIRSSTTGNMVPSDALGGKDWFQQVRRSALEIGQPMFTYSDANSAVNLGFSNVMIDGTQVGWDGAIPANRFVVLPLQRKKDVARTGVSAKMDVDYAMEKHLKSSIYEFDTAALALGVHPRIQGRELAPQGVYRQATQSSWLLWCFNLLFLRPDLITIGYDDASGTKLAAWSA